MERDDPSSIRRRAFERAIARLQARGATFESEPAFLSSIEDWIDGHIDIRELRSRYAKLVRSRAKHSD